MSQETQRWVLSRQKARVGLGLAVATWENRLTSEHDHGFPFINTHTPLIKQVVSDACSGKPQFVGGSVFLSEVLDHAEQLLDRIEQYPETHRDAATGVLVDVIGWLDGMRWRWGDDDQQTEERPFSVLARSFHLRVRTETHPLWGHAVVATGRGGGEASFCTILCGGFGSRQVAGAARFYESTPDGAVLRDAFRASMQNSNANNFENFPLWDRLQFLKSLAEGGGEGGGLNAWLIGDDALEIVGRLLYTQTPAIFGDLSELAPDGTESRALQKLLAVTSDEGVAAAVVAIPRLLEQEAIRVRFQRDALTRLAGDGRPKRPGVL